MNSLEKRKKRCTLPQQRRTKNQLRVHESQRIRFHSIYFEWSFLQDNIRHLILRSNTLHEIENLINIEFGTKLIGCWCKNRNSKPLHILPNKLPCNDTSKCNFQVRIRWIIRARLASGNANFHPLYFRGSSITSSCPNRLLIHVTIFQMDSRSTPNSLNGAEMSYCWNSFDRTTCSKIPFIRWKFIQQLGNLIWDNANKQLDVAKYYEIIESIRLSSISD